MHKRALISVANKQGITRFAKRLQELGYEILSTGGTKRMLEDEGLPVTAVSEVTGFPEILQGRVKTLHPGIHGGILADRSQQEHLEQLKQHEIRLIDIVVVNLYPFTDVIKKQETTFAEAVENIDIGGPTLLRAAAKNHAGVLPIVDPADYDKVIEQLEKGDVSPQWRKKLAVKVFQHTAAYDAAIAEYFAGRVGDFPETLTVVGQKKQTLRYGENPHQKAAFYVTQQAGLQTIAGARQLHGKELSYNNIQDADAAIRLVQEFQETVCVAVKHMNPCGVGRGHTPLEAYERAYRADPVSIFGGIVAFNREIDGLLAKQLTNIFLEIIIAPHFTPDALDQLTRKKNLRLLEVDIETPEKRQYEIKTVGGGWLVQEADELLYNEQNIKIPTKTQPEADQWEALNFAWKVVKHVKSNAIVVADRTKTLGIGAGQMNRVGAAKIAIEAAKNISPDTVLASDAFFPMDDTIEACGKAGIRAVIQPGGSIRDNDSITKADEYGIAMVLAGMRHFKH